MFMSPRVAVKKKEYKKPPSEAQKLKSYFEDVGVIEKPRTEALTISDYAGYFLTRVLKGVTKMKNWSYWKVLVNAVFGGVIGISPPAFERLKEVVDAGDIKILPETYISVMAASSLFAFVVSFFAMMVATTSILKWPLIVDIFAVLGISWAVGVAAFGLFYIYPFHRLNQKKISIDANLPFAINHMAAVAASGIPPEKAFEMIVEFREYEAVSDEAENIVKRITVLGEDITVAIRAVAAKTPSQQFKELLYGILSTIEGGGNLKEYLKEMASLALFNYKLARRRYLETLSTYADMYTAILIAAPLFLVATLAVMNIVPGASFGGMDINRILEISTYGVIPAVNIIFLVFLTVTQPRM